MREKVHYYSKYDMSIPFNLQRAEAVIEKYKAGWRPESVNDVMELHNIWLFVDNGVPAKDWSEEILQLIRTDFKGEVVRFFSALTRDTWVEVFKQTEIDYKHCFWEILDRFNIHGLLDVETVRDAISGSPWELRDLLHQERLVHQNERMIVVLLKENENSAEWLLQEYVEEDSLDSHKKFFFPRSLTFQDKEDIISRYLDGEKPNLNYVRLIQMARMDSNLRLSDRLRLKAQKVEKRLNEEYFPTENVITHKYAVSISSAPNKPLKWVDSDDEGDPVLCYSKEYMLKFRGPELLNYLRFGFEFLTLNGLITLVARESDAGSFERVFSMRGKYSYPTNFVFQYKEAISWLQIEAMQRVLMEEGTSIEDSLKAYYEQYLKEKYSYPSGKLSLASVDADWVTKCKAIAPEIDAIAHRYDQYAKTGSVDEELLMLSKENVRITEVLSATPGCYYTIKGHPGELYRLFYLLFSDQSMLTFIEPFKDSHYDTFYKLLIEQEGKIPYESFQNYQLRDIDYLIEEGYISKDENGMLSIEKNLEIGLLKQLYEYHSCPFHVYGIFERELMREMEKKGWLEKDDHLLTIEERNYFDYYMYNTKYTNGPALRNRYVHGSHADPSKENVHRNAYYRLLILLILELLKIENDLIVRQMASKRVEGNTQQSPETHFKLLASFADIGSYIHAQSKFAGKEYLAVPKKFGIQDGYVYLERNPKLTANPFAYFIKPHTGVCAEYVSFLLNSSWARLDLAPNTPAPTSLTVEKLKAISLPIIPLPEQQVYARLEHVLAPLVAKGEARNRDENLAYNVLSTMREYLCIEMIRPEYTRQHGLEFIAHFMDMMKQLKDIDDATLPIAILKTISIPNNALVDNMKKARVILTDESKS